MADAICPIVEGTKKLLERRTSNFSLLFPRVVKWDITGDTVKSRPDNSEELLKLGNERLPQAGDILKKIHEKQEKVIASMKKSGLKAISIPAKLTAPFVTGLGSGHPTETGMILDRNTGVPFLPASSIKGVLRLAYAVNIANGRSSVPDAELAKFFGDTNTGKNAKRGQIVFLDAYPNVVPKLQADIMNPHYGKYYGREQKLPLETESPVPIKFISVEKETVFCFRAYFLPLLNEGFTDADVRSLEEAFDTAFSTIGFGGKTSIGYGRFKRLNENEVKVEQKKLEEMAEAAKPTLKKGELYDAKIIGKNVKGTCWIAQVDGFEDIKCTLASGNIKDKKEGDIVRIKIISDVNKGNCTCSCL